ncbi:MAG: hypothetical protein LBF01_01630 [Bacteroidales bacterium]|jgi:hypothetical protein|nr:hypothetical protein [Bacteroidales bacterium]
MNMAKKIKADNKPQKCFFDKIEIWLTKHNALLLYICLFVALLFSLLLFNAKITDSSDDASYIEAGYNYAKSFFNYYYTFTATLYPMFLALPIAIFGVNLVVLKFFSVLFFVFGIYFYYKAFRSRVPYLVLFPALFLTAVNYLFLYYAGQTFTEAFTLFMSGLFFIVFFKTDDKTDNGVNIKKNWHCFLLLGFMSFLMCMSRNVAIITPAVILIYFLCQRKYLVALYSLLSFGFIYGLYQKVIIPLCWGHLNIVGQYSSQSNVMFNKDAYNPGMGREDLSGFITRFFENCKIYFSQLFDIVGLRSAGGEYNYIYFVIIAIIFIVAFYFLVQKKNFNKDKSLLAVLFYVIFSCGATFIALHSFWGQGRLIMIYLPLIAIVVFYTFVQLLKTKWLQWIYPVFIIIIIFMNIKTDIAKSSENIPILKKNLAGNRYYGFTPDWINYFKMSEWVAENIGKDTGVACRKGAMSFVYGGRPFVGISGVPTVVTDSALKESNFKNHFIGSKQDGFPPQIHYSITPFMTNIVLNNNRILFVYDLPDSTYNNFVRYADYTKTPYYTDPKDMLQDVAKSNSHYAAYPDSLLMNIKRQNIGYIIDASLRINPSMKTGDVISTIRRYMYFIQVKYPDIFTKTYQIGLNDFEPAYLYKIHYPSNIQ